MPNPIMPTRLSKSLPYRPKRRLNRIDSTKVTTSAQNTPDGYLQYRRTVTSTKHYDAGPFMAPSGYTYTRYRPGDRVPDAILDDNSLVLAGYSNYALTTPPDGLKWVRVGDDALLINADTGMVIQADYDLFGTDDD